MRQLEAKELDSWLSTDRASVTLLDVREPWEAALCAIDSGETVDVLVICLTKHPDVDREHIGREGGIVR